MTTFVKPYPGIDNDVIWIWDGGVVKHPVTITATDTEALLIETAVGADFLKADTTNGILSMPLQGVDAGTDIFRVNKVLKRGGFFTSDLSISNAILQVGQGSALLNAVQSVLALFGSGAAYFTLKDTLNGGEILSGVDSSGGFVSVFSDQSLSFRAGNGAGLGNRNYLIIARGGEIQFTSIGQGTAWYNTADQTTNFEKFLIDWASNEITMFTLNGGTGTARDIKLGTSASHLLFDVSKSSFKFVAGQAPNTRHVTTASDNVLITDGSLRVDRTATSTVALALPAISSVVDGFRIDIIDTGYNALINNITITPNGSDKINNTTSLVLMTNGSVARLEADATNTNWIRL